MPPLASSSSGEYTNNWNNKEPKSSGADYIDRTVNQVFLGNLTDDATLLGTAAQVGLGIAGLDLPMDIRDLTYDLTNWEWTPEHIAQTLLDAVGFIPVIGSLKYADEFAAVLKNANEVADLAKRAPELVDAARAVGKLDDVLGSVDEFGELLESAPEVPCRTRCRRSSGRPKRSSTERPGRHGDGASVPHHRVRNRSITGPICDVTTQKRPFFTELQN